MEKCILHCDLNNFYASVECVDDPSLQKEPVAVCGNPDIRHGIVLAKNNVAKSYKIKTGEPLGSALKKCPNLIIKETNFDKYGYYSKLVRQIYYRFTNKVEPYGLDECWLDVTESLNFYGCGRKIADLIRETVKNELGLTISVGVSYTKIFAKFGSDLRKPNATSVISESNFKFVIWQKPIEEFLMVGRKTAKKMKLLNIHTIGDLAVANEKVLKKKFGIVGVKLKNEANGISFEEVDIFEESDDSKSVGHGITTPRDLTSDDEVKTLIFSLASHVAFRMRSYNLVGSCVNLSIKDSNFEYFSKQFKISTFTNNELIIGRNAYELYKSIYDIDNCPVRAISVAMSNVKEIGENEKNLYDTNLKELDKGMDQLKDKYGFNALVKASTINSDIVLDENVSNDDTIPFKRK